MEPATGTRLVDLGLLLEAAACGHGVAPGRPTLARPWLRAGTVVPLFGISVPARAQYYIATAWPKGPAAVFAEWLRAACHAANESDFASIKLRQRVDVNTVGRSLRTTMAGQ